MGLSSAIDIYGVVVMRVLPSPHKIYKPNQENQSQIIFQNYFKLVLTNSE